MKKLLSTLYISPVLDDYRQNMLSLKGSLFVLQESITNNDCYQQWMIRRRFMCTCSPLFPGQYHQSEKTSILFIYPSVLNDHKILFNILRSICSSSIEFPCPKPFIYSLKYQRLTSKIILCGKT